MSSATAGDELHFREPCFGGEVVVHLSGPHAAELGVTALEQLHRIDRHLSRFKATSELCHLNRDAREAVPSSPLMLDLVAAIIDAGERTAGLVDGTLLDELERAGYVNSMAAGASPLPESPRPAAQAQRSGPDRTRGWRDLSVDRAHGEVLRPPGLRIDSGGLGKGLAADRVAAELAPCPTFCVDCSGDMRIGGVAGLPRTVRVQHPHTGEVACEFEVVDGGIATSGVTRRAWLGDDGRRRHHLIDPRTGEPASTGVVQATALAPTATEAEVLAKAALLTGPDHAADWLPHGGALILQDGSSRHVEPARQLAEAR